MRIAFIWPHGCTDYQTIPLSLGLLQSSIDGSGHVSKMFNLPLEGWRADDPAFQAALKEFQPGLVAISAWAVSFKSSVSAAMTAKACVPEATVLLGGNYPTLSPVEAWAPGCFDYLLMGEAERTFPVFVERLAAGDREGLARIDGIYFVNAQGEVVTTPRPPLEADLDALGVIDYGFIELERALKGGYLATAIGPKRKASMMLSRGCEYNCRYCTAQWMYGRDLRHYSVEYLARQIRLLYDRYRVREIIFQDDNATQGRTFFMDLLRGIIALGMPDMEFEFGRGVRLETLTEEMLDLMKRAGFKRVTIAPESGSDRIRDMMGKDMRRESIENAARLIRAAGLSLQGYFIVGYPSETPEERQETYRMIRELKFDVFSLHKYQAIPGSTAFRQLVAKGQVTPDHTDEAHLIGDPLPNYNNEDPKVLDKEILKTYARFYVTRPWRLVNLLRMASLGGLARAVFGTIRDGVASMLGRSRPDRGLASSGQSG
jgi:radical SAM superfamily enzyme YgiQ (UPF0313 family)